ncbi:MAG: carbohydrate-binding domain-containing protein [Muribaculaceae bacterium]|nr:carbohydrate-binding domain-containing protein [Muribaculaceae bacterium]
MTVKGNASHAIYAKEYIEMSNCNLSLTGAVKDGMNCNQYFTMKSGSLTIDNVGDDGIQVAYKDETDREAEDTGAITIKGGILNVKVAAAAAKGVKCEGSMTITGGDITASVSGHGIWDSAKNKTKASACLASDTDITIDGGTLSLTATGGGGKGINCDGVFMMNSGSVSISTTGGIVAYVNGVLSTNYTGNTDRIASDMKSSPKGIKADSDVVINGGDINITTTGNGGEGIESKSQLTINNGNIVIIAKDDAINSSSHMYIKGGNITAISTSNDGLDSNGNLYIESGYIMTFGAKSPECGLDANDEEGYSVVFTGVTLLAVGGGNSTPSASSGSTQPYVSASSTVSANTSISLKDTSGNELATFTVPSNYSPSSAGMGGDPGGSSNRSSVLVTCAGLTDGSQYTLTTGTTNISVTARTTGSSGGGWGH